jgi:hypothetical protein
MLEVDVTFSIELCKMCFDFSVLMNYTKHGFYSVPYNAIITGCYLVLVILALFSDSYTLM